MKVKYFIRGLGVGIIVTALILAISYKSKYSDEDIILKAKKLGMVFSEDVSGAAIDTDTLKTEVPDVTEAPSPEPTEEIPAVTEPGPESEPTPVPVQPADEPEPSDNPADEPLPSEEPVDVPAPADEPEPEPELISFTIERGDWSRIVAERLEQLGIIDSSKKFDKYLVDNGYAIRIKVGNFSAKKGASYEEIARMISD